MVKSSTSQNHRKIDPAARERGTKSAPASLVPSRFYQAVRVAVGWAHPVAWGAKISEKAGELGLTVGIDTDEREGRERDVRERGEKWDIDD